MARTAAETARVEAPVAALGQSAIGQAVVATARLVALFVAVTLVYAAVFKLPAGKQRRSAPT